MPTPAGNTPAHTLVSLRGRLGTAGSSPETWQIGIRGTGGVGSPLTDTQRSAIVAAAVQYIGTSGFTTAVHLDEVRLANIGTNGHQVGDTTILPAVATGTTTFTMPFQCTLVVSLIAAGRGVGHKGRYYPPPQGFPMSNTDGLVDTGGVSDALGFAKRFVDALNAAGLGVAIIGRSGTAGTAQLVTELRMGRVIDTQRRRRRSLAESYVAVAITG